MSMSLPPWPLFSAFMVASLLLAVTPGPGVLYIVTRSALDGRRHGLTSVLAVALGNLTNAIAAALGLAALFLASSLAFTTVKYAGAAYLVWLGCRMLFARHTDGGASAVRRAPLAQVFRDGFLVAALNPKTTLFFAAFLPQFFGGPANPLGQALALGAIFVAVAMVTDTLYALCAGWIAPRFANRARLGQRTGGSICIGLGLFAALSGQNHQSTTRG